MLFGSWGREHCLGCGDGKLFFRVAAFSMRAEGCLKEGPVLVRHTLAPLLPLINRFGKLFLVSKTHLTQKW